MFPINLQDYFQPLSLSLFIQTIGLVGCWEVIGDSINRKFIKSPDWSRPAWWLFGWGTWIFAWFIVHQFVRLDPVAILATLLILTLVCVPNYLRHASWRTLWASLKQLWLPLLLLIPLVPAIFVKSSLPPYLTDEMAYHFVSPYELAVSTPWKFSSGIYHVIPKSLDLYFQTSFALFHTYMPARLTHFLILLTVFAAAYLWIQKNYGSVRAVVFWLLFFYLPRQDLVTAATSGYVDIATASFVFLGILFTLDSHAPASIAAWALALGSKYTAVISTAAYFLVNLIVSKFKLKTPWKNTLIVFVLLGGFWYLKNLVVTGNPIYPFLFGCREADCIDTASFFGGWTTTIDIRSIPSIFNDVLVGNRKLEIIFLFTLLFPFISKDKMLRRLNFIILTSIAIEFVLIKFFSGFLFRYFWHVQFVTLLFMVLQTVVTVSDWVWVKLFKYGILVALTLFVILNFGRSIRFAFYPDRLPQNEVQYALGRTNIHDWINERFPKMSGVINWCNEQTELTTLRRTDPDIIWFDYEGQMRTFMTNCHITDLGIGSSKTPISQVLTVVKEEQKTPFWYISMTPCIPVGDIKHYDYETTWQRHLRQVNNVIVCSLKEEIVPGLYLYQP